MLEVLFLVVLTIATFASILLVRSFEYMSITELKRQARKGNHDAARVYPVRAYGMQLWILLWAVLGFLTTCIILVLKDLVGSWLVLLINVPLIVVIHAILPWTKRPKPSLHMAAVVSPYIERVLRVTFPVLKWLERWIGRWIQPEPMLLIQSKDELIEILQHNADEFDHVNKHELKIAESALTFGEKLVGDYMTPLNAVNFVNAEEELTPVVLGELHKSGHSRLPVYAGSNQNIVGTLFLKDASRIKDVKPVSKVMRPDVFYVNEAQTLDHALQGFLRAKHHMFVVVNEFEDVVGILTIEDVLEQIIGTSIHDEFDQHDDMRAVAAHTAAQKHKMHVGEHV